MEQVFDTDSAANVVVGTGLLDSRAEFGGCPETPQEMKYVGTETNIVPVNREKTMVHGNGERSVFGVLPPVDPSGSACDFTTYGVSRKFQCAPGTSYSIYAELKDEGQTLDFKIGCMRSIKKDDAQCTLVHPTSQGGFNEAIRHMWLDNSQTSYLDNGWPHTTATAWAEAASGAGHTVYTSQAYAENPYLVQFHEDGPLISNTRCVSL